MKIATGETGRDRARPHTQGRVVPEEVSAYAVKRAYERALTAMQEYRDVLGNSANGADRSYATNDADEFEEVIGEIRTLANQAQGQA